MRSVNEVTLIGNLTRDPEMKQTTSGQSLVTFGMATNRQWTTSTGERKSSAEFHEISVWSNLAEICQKYLRKGMLVYVKGYLKTRNWDREDGTKAHRTEIVASDMIMLERRADGAGDYEAADMNMMGMGGMGMGGYGDDAGMGSDDGGMGGGSATAGATGATGAGATTGDTSAQVQATVTAPAQAPASQASPMGEMKASIDEDNLF